MCRALSKCVLRFRVRHTLNQMPQYVLIFGLLPHELVIAPFLPSVIFDSDTVFIALIVLLGSSVGYIGNLALIQAPKTSEMAESQEATSLILTSFFVLGQASGSFGSYFILKSI